MTIAQQTIERFLNDLAATQPTPGGGAASAMISAIGAALGTMVVGYAQGKPRYADFAEQHAQALIHLNESCTAFLELADRDAQAYAALSAAFAIPKDDPTRESAIGEAARQAIAVPLDAMRHAAALSERLAALRRGTAPQLASDLTIAAIAAEAGCRAFQCLVQANAPYLPDRAEADDAIQAARDSIDRAATALRELTPAS